MQKAPKALQKMTREIFLEIQNHEIEFRTQDGSENAHGNFRK